MSADAFAQRKITQQERIVNSHKYTLENRWDWWKISVYFWLRSKTSNQKAISM